MNSHCKLWRALVSNHIMARHEKQRRRKDVQKLRRLFSAFKQAIPLVTSIKPIQMLIQSYWDFEYYIILRVTQWSRDDPSSQAKRLVDTLDHCNHITKQYASHLHDLRGTYWREVRKYKAELVQLALIYSDRYLVFAKGEYYSPCVRPSCYYSTVDHTCQCGDNFKKEHIS